MILASRHRVRRGAVLLEVMLSLALFATAGLVILSLVGQAADSLGRSRERQLAVDLARSAMSRIEAGIEAPETAQGPVRKWTEPGAEGAFDERLPESTGWTIGVETEPAGVGGGGLTWVEVTAERRDPRSDAVLTAYSLRQAVRLSAAPSDSPLSDAELAEVDP